MSTRLIPCSSCARHVRTSDTACPFCGAATVSAPTLVGPPLARMSRAAFLALGAAGSLAMTDCSSAPVPLYGGTSVTSGSDSTGSSSSSGATSAGSEASASSGDEGRVPADAGVEPQADATTPDATAIDDAAPSESGPSDASLRPDAPFAEPMYGAPAPPPKENDAGGGGVAQPLYGAFPPIRSGH